MPDVKTQRAKGVPPAYAAFAGLFAQMDPNLREVLEGMLAAMERQFPVPSEMTFNSVGDVDGFGGITHRGEISQLLQSELLLRTEAPLEFMRRLVEREALYNEWQFSTPGRQEILRVVVSTGPGILGHGRLVSLAGLFYLAARAQKLGKKFHWTFLPRSEGAVWFDELNVNSVKRYLKTGAARECDGSDFSQAMQSWQDWTGPAASLDRVADWIIGVPEHEASALNAKARRLDIRLDPPVRGEPRKALVGIVQPNGQRHAARVVFPDDTVCLSALQVPFSPLRPEHRRADGTFEVLQHWEPVFFSGRNSDGLLVRTKEGLLLLRQYKNETFQDVHYLEVPDHARLAGVQQLGNELHFCFWLPGEAGTSMGELVYGRTPLGSISALTNNQVVHGVPETFFSGQPAYGLPTVFAGCGLEGFTARGRQMRAAPGSALQLDEAFVYTASGSVHIRSVDKEQADILVVERDANRRVAEFSFDELRGKTRRDLWGLSFNLNGRQLAYSLEPGEWRVPNSHGRKVRNAGGRLAEVDSCIAVINTLPSDRVLRATARGMDVTFLVWSDPSAGGDGHLHSLRSPDGRAVERTVDCRLEDAACVVKADYLSDGSLWAVWADGSGAPEWIARLNRKQRKSPSGLARYKRLNLRKLQDEASRIDLGGLLG
ncbi:MAG: hypothetical protein FP825_08645 [Hyphomonas sp.]|uniref:hypothetical protein n=1 Tax=Hyphomonas sp. TaxID=87 RepID=UPI0017EF7B7C|nr:hypothetical protein [Hyphomonas sp.]MBA3068534.1 hypothetical protein [Hyphomonas sp.]MBU3920975.1 hypothetical protein [Alphaproteobacteria bacterium]MBU4060598.1 hypothetical protein [Alphaproteobacteria bacterium]MBU4164582.1 hypothetical protein [Alphaproteobacteria bacterium]